MFFGKFSRKFKIAFIVFVGLVFIAFFSYVLSSLARNRVPSLFNDARVASSIIAEDIVKMLGETSQNMSNVQDLEKQRRLSSALDIVSSEIEKNRIISDKASALAIELEKMAMEIPNISPSDAAQTALVAISSETALINQLIVYNNKIYELWRLLQEKFSGSTEDINHLNKVVDEINEKTKSINNLNDQFGQLMENFDEYYK